MGAWKVGVALLAVVLAVGLLACGVEGQKRFDKHQLALELVARAATARVLHEHPTWQEKVVEITGAAGAALEEGEITTVDGLVLLVQAKVPWSQLMPEEQALVQVTISAVAQELQNALEARGMPSQEASGFAIRASLVLGWIRDTAELRAL